MKPQLSNLDKIYWPKEKITKGDLIKYYQKVGKIILPYLKDRPQSLKRCPDGINAPCFFQKNLTTHPDWVKTVKIQHTGKYINYLLIQDLDSLLYAVNLGCIELHPLLAKYQQINNPDYMVLDLDPKQATFEKVIDTANAIHEVLEEFSIPNYCKTSGATGLHIYIPLKGKYTFEQSKQFGQLIASITNDRIPEITTLIRDPKKRGKKVYIDFLQNNKGQTIAAPYCVRARPMAPVSTPLKWSEVKKGLEPTDYNIKTVLKRLDKWGDIFKPVLGKGVSIEKVLKKYG